MFEAGRVVILDDLPGEVSADSADEIDSKEPDPDVPDTTSPLSTLVLVDLFDVCG